ncbi:hypothetical protein [Acetobacter ascendens]|uniref:hypothetical protein n=1 Tax=Acetobacter ascendens TaxID=481146 RepID=UPI001EF5A7B2|nr:hypothetical protein [Acetobacter ascendens]
MPSNSNPHQKSALASPYVRRILLVALLLIGGFTLMCFTGWLAVTHSHVQDSWAMVAFRWLFPVIGAVMVVAGFVFLNRPVGNVWENFEASSDDEDADEIVSNMDGR